MTQAPFYWNYNPAPGYNASSDPAYAAAIEQYRNKGLQDAEQAQEDLLTQKQANLTKNDATINNSFDANFNPDFYNGYAKQLMNYWQPDLDQQHTDAQHQLNYTFADAQPGGGSAPAEAFGRLQRAYDTAELTANDNATAQANQLKTNVEGRRSALLASVNGDTDPGAATQQTANSIGSIPLQPAYSTMGDIFSSITGQAANAIGAARSGSVYGLNTGTSTAASNPGSSLKIIA